MKENIITSINQIKHGKRYEFLNKNDKWVLISDYWAARYHVATNKEVREIKSL